ncbi:MAG: sulfatase [Gemmatimonadota bacterium]
MINRHSLIVLFVALGSACHDQAPSPDTTPGPLNIVLILTDDQRPNTLAYMPRTLALLAAQGVEFTNAFATTPLCCPSRSSILTGLYTHNHGVLSNVPPAGGAPRFVDTSTVATWLQHAGYRTALIGKYLNAYDQLLPFPHRPPGWSTWRAFKVTDYYNYVLVEDSTQVPFGAAPTDYSTDVLSSEAQAFIESTPDSQPLFLYFAPYAPHNPAIPALQDQGVFSGLPPWRPPSYNEADMSDKPVWVRTIPVVTPELSDTMDLFVQHQIETLLAVDRAVDQLLQTLTRTGRLDRTVIIFTSDNGFSWGEHRLFGKDCVYEECIRVPLIVRGPGIAPRQDGHIVALMDLAPTIARLAGISPPGKVNGVNLVPLWQNPGAPWRQDLLFEVLAQVLQVGTFSAVRTDRFVYSELASGERELYDLQSDPFQLTNLASDPSQAGLIATLRVRLLALMAE